MADAILRPGLKIGDRFVLKRQLGLGGVGAVWLASDPEVLKADVALKILYGRFGKIPSAIKQLSREAHLLAQLDHPNIARPFGFHSDEQFTYLAMEFIDGHALDREIGLHSTQKKFFQDDQAIRIFEELCSAVGYAHSREIIHRDIKPMNVMVLRQPETAAVKVLDFGIAKILEGNLFDSTTFGRRVGSLFYMSPEQGRGEPADRRSDVFALGSVLFEILTLRRAWAWDASDVPLPAFSSPVMEDGSNAVANIFGRISSGPRPRASSVRPELPSRLDELLDKAMAVDPNERFQTVDELVRAFRLATVGLRSAELQATEIWDAASEPVDDGETTVAPADPGRREIDSGTRTQAKPPPWLRDAKTTMLAPVGRDLVDEVTVRESEKHSAEPRLMSARPSAAIVDPSGTEEAVRIGEPPALHLPQSSGSHGVTAPEPPSGPAPMACAPVPVPYGQTDLSVGAEPTRRLGGLTLAVIFGGVAIVVALIVVLIAYGLDLGT